MSTTPAAGRAPYEKAPSTQKGSLIWFHGLGDQGNGWAQILSEVVTKHGVKVICPNAASRPVHLNFGMSMPAWFDIFGLSPDSPEDLEGIKQATQYAHSLIQKEIDAGVDPKKIAIGGFSMGGALALHAALTYPTSIGTVVGLSSFLLQRDAVEGQCTGNKNIPVFLGHGRNDVLVPYTFGQMTEQKLKTFNPNVVFKGYNVDHSTTDEELKDVAKFLKQNLNL